MRTHGPQRKEKTHRQPSIDRRAADQWRGLRRDLHNRRLVISSFAGEFASRSFLVLFLFIAAGLYIVFALRAGEGILWIVGEVVGVAIFGGMA